MLDTCEPALQVLSSVKAQVWALHGWFPTWLFGLEKRQMRIFICWKIRDLRMVSAQDGRSHHCSFCEVDHPWDRQFTASWTQFSQKCGLYLIPYTCFFGPGKISSSSQDAPSWVIQSTISQNVLFILPPAVYDTLFKMEDLFSTFPIEYLLVNLLAAPWSLDCAISWAPCFKGEAR